MPAGRASIIAYTMPAWAMLFGALALARASCRARGVVGLALGMAGIAVLLVPDSQRAAAPLGALAMLGAAAAWAAGSVVMKRFAGRPGSRAHRLAVDVSAAFPSCSPASLLGPFPGSICRLAGLAGSSMSSSSACCSPMGLVHGARPVARRRRLDRHAGDPRDRRAVLDGPARRNVGCQRSDSVGPGGRSAGAGPWPALISVALDQAWARLGR